MASQLTDAALKLRGYHHNIREKLHSAQISGGGLIERATRVVHDLTAELTPPPPWTSRSQSANRPFRPMKSVQV